MNQMKRQRNEIVKIYVFSMLQMILIRNLERVISRKADQDEESPNPSRQNNHPKDSWAEKLFSQDHFHMLSDWLSKLLINIILILRICFDISSFLRNNNLLLISVSAAVKNPNHLALNISNLTPRGQPDTLALSKMFDLGFLWAESPGFCGEPWTH